MRKKFTKEEEQYIEQYFGAVSAERIGERLGVSAKSVVNKAYKMGLTSLIGSSGRMTANTLASLVGHDFKVVKRWVDNHGLPHMRRSLNVKTKNKHILIDAEEFWEWAEQNKERIDFLRIEKNSIVPEPKWVEGERRKLMQNPKKIRKVWTQQEEVRLWNMFYTAGMKQKDIAKKFNVTPTAIERKLKALRDKGGQTYISSISA